MADVTYKDYPNKLKVPAAYVYDADAIRESVERLLLTERGSLMDQPEYGCGLPSYKYELITSSTKVFMEMDIKDSLARWEPRVEFRGAKIDVNEDEGTITIAVAIYIPEFDKFVQILVNPFED